MKFAEWANSNLLQQTVTVFAATCSGIIITSFNSIFLILFYYEIVHKVHNKNKRKK